MSNPPEGVDLEVLRPYFAANVRDATDAPLDAELIAGGRSNLTYIVSQADAGMGRTWVLRRPPLGHVLPTAHDMEREARVLGALGPGPVPVPEVFAVCTDPSVLGTPFYVMERLDGRILRTADEAATLDVVEARACSEALVDVLVDIHGVDPEAVGLGDFGHPEGFVARQVRRWSQQWERSKTRELPAIDELSRRLAAGVPVSGPPTLVHGDYRLDNTILAADDPGRIAGVLDWEMATLGDPLTDLGLFLLYWDQPDATIAGSTEAVGMLPGFLPRDEIVARYARASGRRVDDLDYYEILARFKLAIILEGINARFQMGKTLGEGFDHMGEMATVLADTALDLANGSANPALRG
ncbi:MAG: putative aminoglycoside phosphotransferase [Actinomycetia bacterium]|nr:putative aminoglycoside phosphotransferase [Actinomycetes bacterium]